MAGYSGRPLHAKLGIAEGMPALVVHGPPNYAELVAPLPAGARLVQDHPGAPGDDAPFAHVFATERAVLEAEIPRLGAVIAKNGMVWVSWPKKASKVPTDITEGTIRDIALPLGLVDVKVCAVDATWSGLKLVWRKELR